MKISMHVGSPVFVVMWFLVVPAIDPVMLRLNGMVFAIAHMMWGARLPDEHGVDPGSANAAPPAHNSTTRR